MDGQRYACIHDVNRLDPFLMSIVSDSDAWLFVGSNSPFTAGRVDPDHAMFPYETVDKLLRHPDGSGSLSAFRVRRGGPSSSLWEPWRSDAHASPVTRNLYKHVLGTSVVFEEINHELALRFTWSLSTCAQFGLVRHSVLENIGSGPVRVDYLDGFQMLLPPGVGEEAYARLSYLAAAYMRHEVVPDVPLAIYTLNSAIEDKPLPYESLRATCAWSVGHLHPQVVLSDRHLRMFRAGDKIAVEGERRGDFGSYLVADSVELEPGGGTNGPQLPTRLSTTLGSSGCATSSRSPTCSRPSFARPSQLIARVCAGSWLRPMGCRRRPTRRPPFTTSAAFSSTVCVAGPSWTRTDFRGAISTRS